jgi:hypothetical protein
MPEYIINKLTLIAINEYGNPICDSNDQPIEYDVDDLDFSSICDDINHAINEGDAYVTPLNPSN